MFDYAQTTALITGASSGIGREFAHALAERRSNLLLVARSADKLTSLAEELRTIYNVRVEVIPSDLSRPHAGQAVYQDALDRGMMPNLIVNNAGFATYGYFDELSIERQREEIMLNVLAVVELTHAALPAMLANGYGGVINVSSTAAFQPDPYMAIYGATKAFILSWSEALWAENQRRGIRVVALAPGATDTAFFDVVGASEASVGSRSRPEDVVAAGLRALNRNQSFVIPGWQNYLLAQLNRLLPRAVVASITDRILRPQPESSAKRTSYS
jgi:hypothetical protein